MKRSIIILSAVLSIVAACSGVFAHEMWANAEYSEGLLKADLGYGHVFPVPEEIPADRTHLFEALKLVAPDGTKEMTQTGKNYHYELKVDMPKGDYIIRADYVPTFWAEGKDGWKQTDRAGYKKLTGSDPTHVEEAIMYAKYIFNVDGADSTNVITKPVGQKLEIVPQVNPATVKPEGRFPVQVLLDGKPAASVEVKGVYDGFNGRAEEEDPANGYKAFYGKTDSNGIVNIIPVKAGYWNVYVQIEPEYPDKSVADVYVLVSRMSFNINN